MLTTPPIYCVTLAEEPWKERIVSEHFKASNVSAKFVYGFSGVTIGMKPTNPYTFDDKGNGIFMHPSQLGCLLSHLLALKMAISEGASEFIICEDDVKLCGNFVEHFSRFRSALPKDANIAQLEYIGWEDKPQERINDRVARVQYPFCTACIWWKRDAAQLAARTLKPMDRPYDIALIQRVYPFLNHYVAMPALAGQKSVTGEWPSAVDSAPKEEKPIV